MVLSLLLMALNGCGFVLRFREKGFMSDCWAFVPFFLFGTFFMCYAASMINEPHYGRTPTIRDVPKDAHVDTSYVISGTDTVPAYTIEWNDEEGTR